MIGGIKIQICKICKREVDMELDGCDICKRLTCPRCASSDGPGTWVCNDCREKRADG
jgi:hypothetical protein